MTERHLEFNTIMIPKTYQRLALRTKSRKIPLNLGQTPKECIQLNDLLHAAMGLETEVGEFMDPLKKHFFYDKPIDFVNLKEEIGDILWYIAIACDALGTDIEVEMIRNIEKLRARFPDKFDEHRAINRDLEKERSILENGYEN